MGWLRKKFKNIESRIDEVGEKLEESIKQEKQKREEEERAKKRQWENLKWYQKLAIIITCAFVCIIFWIIIGPPLWKLLCKLLQLGISYQIWKELKAVFF